MTDNEDIKAKMREALDRKKAHDDVAHEDHAKQQAPKTNGPRSSERMFRRKSGSS